MSLSSPYTTAILIAIRDKKRRAMLEAQLQPTDLNVYVAATAEQAHQIVQSKAPEIILMHCGEEGITLIRHWRQQENAQSSYIIAMVPPSQAERALEAGADQIFEPQTPVETLGHALQTSARVLKRIHSTNNGATPYTSHSDQAHLVRVLAEATSALSSTLQVRDVIDRILDYVMQAITCTTASVMLIDKTYPDKAHIAAYRGYEQPFDGYRKLWHEMTWDINETWTLQQMSETKSPLLIPNVLEAVGWLHHESPVRSFLGAPIVFEDELLGFINLDSDYADSFDHIHAQHLMAFANQVGIAIKNARLHEEVRTYAGQLEQFVEQRTKELSRANQRLTEQVNDRKRIEEALIDERNLLRTVIDHLPDSIYVRNAQGKHILVNRTLWRKMTDRQIKPQPPRERDETIDYIPVAVPENLGTPDEVVMESGELIVDQEVMTGTDEHFLVTKVPLTDNHGHVNGLVGIHRDITDLRHADEALKEERNLLRSLLDNIPDEIYVKDSQGRFLLVNRAIINRIGHRAPGGQVIGSTNYDYADDDYTRKLVEDAEISDRQILEHGHVIREEIEIHDKRRGKIWFASTRIPLRDSRGNVIGVIGLNRDITEERQALERVEHIINGADCLLWYGIVNVETSSEPRWDVFVSSEKAAQRFLPLTLEDAESYADAWQRSIITSDLQKTRGNIASAIQTGQQSTIHELRCRRADGSIRWLREAVQIRSLTPGRYSLVGVCTDVTEAHEAEATLQRANELLEKRVQERTSRLTEANRQLLEQINERQKAETAEREQRKLAETLIEAAAALGETLDLNQVLDRMLTFAGRVLPPHRAAHVMHLDEHLFVHSLRYLRMQEGKFTVEAGISPLSIKTVPLLKRVYDGEAQVIEDVRDSELWVPLSHMEWVRSWICVPMQVEGEVIGFVSLASDIIGQFRDEHVTRLIAFSNQAGIAIQNARLFAEVQSYASDLEQRVAQRTNELDQERAQLYAILNAMADGVIYYDINQRPQYINRALERLTGYKLQDWLMAETWSHLIHVSNEERAALLAEADQRVNQHGIWRKEIRMQRKNGDEFDADLIMTSVRDAGGRASGNVIVLRDISAEKRLEAQKSRFIATASHELRTPITNLKTRLYLIERQPDRIGEHLEIMSTVTNRMRKLVDDLLDVSRFQNGIITLDEQEVVLQDLIHSVAEIQRPTADVKAIDIVETMPAEEIRVIVDESRMLQVITNLITNAINYTLEGGEISIRLELHKNGDPTHPGYAMFAISDTGIGIPQDLLPDIFKPFFRINDYNAGMGLGLSITREIVELHGGKIEVRSVLEEGTTFEVYLPLPDPDLLAPPATIDAEEST